MTTVAGCASGWLDIEGPDADAVGANGCGEGGSGAVGLGICFGLGGGGDGIGEWLGVIGLVDIWLGEGSWICGGEFSWRSKNSSLISRFISSMSSPSSSPVGSLAGGLGSRLVEMYDVF